MLNRDRHGRLKEWHGDLEQRHQEKMERIDKRIDNLPDDDTKHPKRDAAQDEADDAKRAARVAEGVRRLTEHYQLGDGPDPALQSTRETLMSGSEVSVSDDRVRFDAPVPDDEGIKVVDTRVEERVRYDFTLVVGRVVADVEKKVIVDGEGNRRMISASTAPLGPPRFAVTWRFLINMVVLVVQYAMPMNRLANLLSTDDKRFTSGALARMLRMVAERFIPIYLHMFDELADAEIMQGDDTSPRVLEVKRHFARDTDEGTDQESPWHSYRTREVAAETLAKERGPPPPGAKNHHASMGARLSSELGFEFARRTGDGTKRALNTSVVSGRTDQSDPRSLTVLYRSHLGSFGNLLEVLLERRNPRNVNVLVQSDLATVNLVHDPQLRQRFKIEQYGCASHARRPFAQFEHEDPELCDMMLHFFKGVFLHEDGLDLYGRNAQNVTAVRDVDSREQWENIRKLARIMTKKWSPKTKLGEAARYILRHYEALTAHLKDPRLSPTNNFSERMLRMEKLIQSGSMFRATLDGRFALDILRSIMQTAIVAGAPLQEYLLNILLMPREEIESHPERYTPRAWSRAYDYAATPQDDAESSPAEVDTPAA